MINRKKALRRRQMQKYFADYTDTELQIMFDKIGDDPWNRVKSGNRKGQLKVKAMQYGDDIIDELRARKIERAVCAEAADWAKHFRVTDPVWIEERRKVMRANAAVGYMEPLEPYLYADHLTVTVA